MVQKEDYPQGNQEIRVSKNPPFKKQGFLLSCFQGPIVSMVKQRSPKL